jgi:hypothetical protein
MKHAPLVYTWEGDGFKPVPRHAKACDQQFVIGERYLMEQVHERDMVKHNRQFAFVAEGWKNLPERYADEPWAQSPDHLRKHALIKNGFCHTETFPCGSNAEAMRWAPRLRADNEYAIISVKGTLVYRFTAESQSKRTMGAERFYESRKAVMAFVDGLLGVSPGETQKNAEQVA